MKNKMVFSALIVAVFQFSWALAWAHSQSRDAQTLSGSMRNVTTEAVQRVASQLMAPCCWSGTADAHTSQIAYDMRTQIREALAQGQSEQEILQAYVATYGERILAKPTKEGFNLLAWVLPFFALLAGGYLLWRFLHRHVEPARAPVATAMNANDPYMQRLEKELQEFAK